jgi:hypothetical protein
MAASPASIPVPRTFATVELLQFRRALARHHAEVARGFGRIEITHPEHSDVCVLISKAELDSLEQALEILSATADYQAMCQQIADCAAATCRPAE